MYVGNCVFCFLTPQGSLEVPKKQVLVHQTRARIIGLMNNGSRLLLRDLNFFLHRNFKPLPVKILDDFLLPISFKFFPIQEYDYVGLWFSDWLAVENYNGVLIE